MIINFDTISLCLALATLYNFCWAKEKFQKKKKRKRLSLGAKGGSCT